jgi:hypothetical protein
VAAVGGHAVLAAPFTVLPVGVLHYVFVIATRS